MAGIVDSVAARLASALERGAAELLAIWRLGVLVRLPRGGLCRADVSKSGRVLLRLRLPASDDPVSALAWADGVVEAVLERWYGLEPHAAVECSVCAANRLAEHLFSITDCERAAALAEPVVRCERVQVSMPLRLLAPDVVSAMWGGGAAQAIDEAEITARSVVFGNEAFGVCVWRATWAGQPVAVKRVTGGTETAGTSAEDGDESERRKLKTEMSLLASLSHENIVKLHGFTRLPDVAIVLEWVRHGSLFGLLNDELVAKAAHHVMSAAVGLLVQRRRGEALIASVETTIEDAAKKWASSLASSPTISKAADAYIGVLRDVVAAGKARPEVTGTGESSMEARFVMMNSQRTHARTHALTQRN